MAADGRPFALGSEDRLGFTPKWWLSAVWLWEEDCRGWAALQAAARTQVPAAKCPLRLGLGHGGVHRGRRKLGHAHCMPVRLSCLSGAVSHCPGLGVLCVWSSSYTQGRGGLKPRGLQQGIQGQARWVRAHRPSGVWPPTSPAACPGPTHASQSPSFSLPEGSSCF